MDVCSKGTGSKWKVSGQNGRGRGQNERRRGQNEKEAWPVCQGGCGLDGSVFKRGVI